MHYDSGMSFSWWAFCVRLLGYPVFAWLLTRMWSISVFHAALLVMAALQVHETRAAVVTNPGRNWTQDYLVCGFLTSRRSN